MESNLPKAAQLLPWPNQVYKLESFDALFDNAFHLCRLFMEHFHILSFISRDGHGSRQVSWASRFYTGICGRRPGTWD